NSRIFQRHTKYAPQTGMLSRLKQTNIFKPKRESGSAVPLGLVLCVRWIPALKRRAYSPSSLRDGELACSIATTIIGRKTNANPQNPPLSRALVSAPV